MNQKYITTAAYYLAFILLGLSIGVEGPTLTRLAENTSSAYNEINQMFLVGSLGYLLGSYIGGRLYDRVRGHQLMAGVLVVIGFFIAFIPIVTSLFALLFVVLVLGFAKGALDVGGNTLILWVHDEKVDPYMNGLHAFFGLGATGGGLIVARVLTLTGNIYWVYWTLAIAAFPIAAWIWNMPSPSPRVTPDQHKDMPLPFLPVSIMVLCFVLYVGAEVGYGSWLATYASQKGLETEIAAARLTSAFWGAFTVGRFIGIWVSTRLRPLTILYLDFTGCILSLGLILLFNDSASALWTGSVLLGISFASIFPTFMTLTEERMHITGTMAGWFLVGGSLGGLIPWGIGQAFVSIGAGSMIVIVLAGIVLNLLALVLFTRVSIRSRPTGTRIAAE